MGTIDLILITAALVGSVLVLRVLLRPRRRGNTPHCARCDYNLTGLTSNRCPECGAEMVPENIVYGELVARPWGKALAFVTVVALLIPAIRWAWSYDWYRVRPTSWVIGDLQSADAPGKSRAWRELDRRIRAGSLSTGQESRLIDVCLQEQTAKTPLTAMIDYLGPCLLSDRMSDSQRAVFFRQVMQFEMTARPVVIAGNTLPVRISERSRGPASSGLWIREYSSRAPDLDGQPYKGPRGAWSITPMGNSGSRTGTQPFAPTLWGKEISPGKHRLTLTVQLEVYSGRPEDMGEAGRLYKGEIPLQASFELLATEPPDHIRLVDDPTFKPQLMTAIQMERARWDYGPKGVGISLKLHSLPVNVAFEAVARTGSREYPCGNLTMAKDGSTSYGLHADIPRDVTRFDLILRSSKEAAMGTVDLFEIWQGELVYPNLKIEPIPQSRPRTSPR